MVEGGQPLRRAPPAAPRVKNTHWRGGSTHPNRTSRGPPPLQLDWRQLFGWQRLPPIDVMQWSGRLRPIPMRQHHWGASLIGHQTSSGHNRPHAYGQNTGTNSGQTPSKPIMRGSLYHQLTLRAEFLDEVHEYRVKSSIARHGMLLQHDAILFSKSELPVDSTVVAPIRSIVDIIFTVCIVQRRNRLLQLHLFMQQLHQDVYTVLRVNISSLHHFDEHIMDDNPHITDTDYLVFIPPSVLSTQNI